MEKAQVRSYRDFECYKKSFDVAMEVFRFTVSFPREERYGLIDQMRRSSRSIPANIAEGWAKRRYENVFKRHLVDAIGSAEEMKVWLDFSRECGYMDYALHQDVREQYVGISKMLHSLIEKWRTYS